METEAYALSSGGKAQTEGPDRGARRVPPDRDRPEPQKARQSHNKTAAAAHDDLIHAKRIETRNPINPNRLSTAAQVTRKCPLLLKADIETRLQPEFFNTLG
jgi:hypothetical protein